MGALFPDRFRGRGGWLVLHCKQGGANVFMVVTVVTFLHGICHMVWGQSVCHTLGVRLAAKQYHCCVVPVCPCLSCNMRITIADYSTLGKVGPTQQFLNVDIGCVWYRLSNCAVGSQCTCFNHWCGRAHNTTQHVSHSLHLGPQP